jgi:hypothetical protein
VRALSSIRRECREWRYWLHRRTRRTPPEAVRLVHQCFSASGRSLSQRDRSVCTSLMIHHIVPSLVLPFFFFTASCSRVCLCVPVCVLTIAYGTGVRGDLPRNEDVIMNFVNWEQSLRRDLTQDIWKVHHSNAGRHVDLSCAVLLYGICRRANIVRFNFYVTFSQIQMSWLVRGSSLIYQAAEAFRPLWQCRPICIWA